MKRLCLIVGARPNFVKAAPLVTALRKEPLFRFSILHTGQHSDPSLSKVFLEKLGIGKPDITLNIKKYTDRQQRIGLMVCQIGRFLAKNKFDLVIVVGDCDSTLAGALAATKQKLLLAHIEAGLRSHDAKMPEETNRFIVDQLSNLHFITEPSARKNLLAEGFIKNTIKFVGNLMIENLINHQDKINNSKILEKLSLNQPSYLVVTLHRFENISSKNNLSNSLRLLRQLSQKYRLVFPSHPHTQKQIIFFGLQKSLPTCITTDPLDYFDFLKLVSNSLGVITDSGGIQEETTFLGIRCATLRDNTERPITINQGTNKLFPLDSSIDSIVNHLRSQTAPTKIRHWDNSVSQRIINTLKTYL